MTTLTGWIRLLPFGMAHSLPPMPTGTIGTPARAATKAAPSKRGCTVGPDWRVPSGNSTTGSPDRSASSQIRSASRSGVPRCTGKPPSELNRAPDQRYFHRLSLPMNRIRRRVRQPASRVSILERWTGAITYGPARGDVLAAPDLDPPVGPAEPLHHPPGDGVPGQPESRAGHLGRLAVPTARSGGALRRGQGEDLVDHVVDVRARWCRCGPRRRRRSGATRPGGVDVIPPGDVGGDLVVVQVEHLFAAPAGPFPVVGGEVHLHRRWETRPCRCRGPRPLRPRGRRPIPAAERPTRSGPPGWRPRCSPPG